MFETIADGLIQKSIYINDQIFPKEFSAQLYQQALHLHETGQTKLAAVGINLLRKKLPQVRGDSISWVNDWNKTPELKIYHSFLEELRISLNRQLLISLKSFEMHFSVYPKGAFYKKHLDQHKESRHR